MYDVIVVGARPAGSATAMLLARRGLRVLVVDRATFPSDTLSTHQVQLPGVARLQRWGLLERIVAAGTPPARRVRFDVGPTVLDGHYPSFEGIDALYSPRRTVLDTILVDAARGAGAEVREGFTVDELVVDEGTVAGVRGRSAGSAAVEERAKLVIGADGRHSFVASAVDAQVVREEAPRAIAYYTYWDGVPTDGGELYSRDRRMIGVWPTNDGLTMTFVSAPIAEFGAFRADIEGHALRSFDLARDVGDRVRSGRRAERWYGTADIPSRIRVPFGPGWALAGDAGLVMDPATGQGIGHALRDADLLADAVATGLGGSRALDEALADYARQRDRQTLPMYEFTLHLASHEPPRPGSEILFPAIARHPEEVSRFLGAISGTEPIGAYMSGRNIMGLVGLSGMARMMWLGARSGRARSSAASPSAAASVGRAAENGGDERIAADVATRRIKPRLPGQ
jgi:2-polyprenyl-6-methoxyphenol hydroxylase-like FAD-dependent oxidoreductase